MAINRTGEAANMPDDSNGSIDRKKIIKALESYLSDLADVELRDIARFKRRKRDADLLPAAFARKALLNSIRAWIRVNI